MPRARTKSFVESEIICHEGEPANCLYILRSGRVAVEVDAAGRAVSVAEVSEPGSIVGEAGLFLGRRTATLRALTSDTRLQEVVFDAGGFRTMIEQRPDTGYKVCRSLALRLKNLSEKMRSVSEATNTVHLMYDSLALSYRGLVSTLQDEAQRDAALKPALAFAVQSVLYKHAQQLRRKLASSRSLFASALRHQAGSMVLEPGTFLFPPHSSDGDPGTTAFLIESGEIDMSIGDHAVATLGPGELIGVTALLLKAPFPSTTVYTARVGARVTPISAEEFELIASQTPEFLYNLAASLCRRIESTNRMARDKSGAVAEELDLLAGSPGSCEAVLRELAERLSGRATEDLVARTLSQADRAAKARDRMAQTYMAFL
jgi:CRP-like cAMP-binding protein